MAAVDQFATVLLEEAKRFLEKSKAETSADGKTAYLHAALNLGFCALEAHINSIADDFSSRQDLSPLDRSILLEKRVELKNGRFELVDKLKLFRLEERMEYFHRKFSGKPLDKSVSWWSQLKDGLDLRNGLTHPKNEPQVDEKLVSRALQAIIDAIDSLYKAVYKKRFPGIRRSLNSNLTF